nr:aminotransferase class I/II-fold pyridoxal phosphate-dependent enzyme [Schwartzia sp. (in: firmicutes)]
EALAIVEKEPERVACLQENTRVFIAALRENGVHAKSDSAIVPIVIGDERRATEAAKRLYDEGIFLSAIRYPTVAKGSARLRAAIMATHTKSELREAAAKIAAVVSEQ